MKTAANATSIVVGIVRVVDGADDGGRRDEGPAGGRARRLDFGQLRFKEFAKFKNRFVLRELAIKIANAGRGRFVATLGRTRETTAGFRFVKTVVSAKTVKTVGVGCVAASVGGENIRVCFRRVEQIANLRGGAESLGERRADFSLFAFAIVALLAFGAREGNDKNVRRFGRDRAKRRRLRRQNATESARRVEPSGGEFLRGKSEPRGGGDRFARRFAVWLAV